MKKYLYLIIVFFCSILCIANSSLKFQQRLTNLSKKDLNTFWPLIVNSRLKTIKNEGKVVSPQYELIFEKMIKGRKIPYQMKVGFEIFSKAVVDVLLKIGKTKSEHEALRVINDEIAMMQQHKDDISNALKNEKEEFNKLLWKKLEDYRETVQYDMYLIKDIVLHEK